MIANISNIRWCDMIEINFVFLMCFNLFWFIFSMQNFLLHFKKKLIQYLLLIWYLMMRFWMRCHKFDWINLICWTKTRLKVFIQFITDFIHFTDRMLIIVNNESFNDMFYVDVILFQKKFDFLNWWSWQSSQEQIWQRLQPSILL